MFFRPVSGHQHVEHDKKKVGVGKFIFVFIASLLLMSATQSCFACHRLITTGPRKSNCFIGCHISSAKDTKNALRKFWFKKKFFLISLLDVTTLPLPSWIKEAHVLVDGAMRRWRHRKSSSFIGCHFIDVAATTQSVCYRSFVSNYSDLFSSPRAAPAKKRRY